MGGSDKWDVIVIGGGPAGLLAAIGASRAGARVQLLEKGDRLGRKLLISGGGRCNVTNSRGIEHIMENIPGNGRFLHSVLRQWSNEDIVTFFAELGVQLKEEDRGRLFPVTDRADTVLQALLRHLDELGVDIRLHAVVSDVIVSDDGRVQGVVLGKQQLAAEAVIIAAGGCSVPKTGSTGDGYGWAEKAGHRIVDVYPTSVALTACDDWIVERSLQGVSMYGVELTLYNSKAKVVCREEGDVVFTHFGLSGPAALRVSQYVVKELRQSGSHEVALSINLFPSLSKSEFLTKWREMAFSHPRRSLKNTIREQVPERIADLACSQLQLAPDIAATTVSSIQWEHLTAWLQSMPLRISGTLGLERATVTGGGVHVKEIDPSTMASKLARGLYFAGEVMDVHAHTGGYNITVAFSSGYVAGKSAAHYAFMQKE